MLCLHVYNVCMYHVLMEVRRTAPSHVLSATVTLLSQPFKRLISIFCIVCVCMSICHMCGYPKKPEDIEAPITGVRDNCEQPCGSSGRAGHDLKSWDISLVLLDFFSLFYFASRSTPLDRELLMPGQINPFTGNNIWRCVFMRFQFFEHTCFFV